MIIGFIDVNGDGIKYGDVAAGKGDWPNNIRPILMAMAQDEYRRARRREDEGIDISVTELWTPFRILLLSQRHQFYVSWETAFDAWEGNVLHARLAQVKGAETEQLLSVEIDDVKIGGHIDRRDDNIVDWKWTKQYTYNRIQKEGIQMAQPSWWLQQNSYWWLALQNGYEIEKMIIVMRLKDWSATSWQNRHHADYPQTPLVSIEVPIDLDIETKIRKRIALYKKYRSVADVDLPLCPEEDTWEGKRCEKYCQVSKICQSLLKFDWQKAWLQTKAVLPFDTEDEARAWLFDFTRKEPQEIIARQTWVNIYKKAKKEKKKNEKRNSSNNQSNR